MYSPSYGVFHQHSCLRDPDTCSLSPKPARLPREERTGERLVLKPDATCGMEMITIRTVKGKKEIAVGC